MRRVGHPTSAPYAALLLAVLPGCGTLTGRLWRDFPDDNFRVETTTHRVEDGALHVARAADGPGSRVAAAEAGEGPLLAVQTRVAGLPEPWRSLLAPFGGSRTWLVFRGSLRARAVAAVLERKLGLEPESCDVLFRQGVGADGRMPLPALVLIQGRVRRKSFGEVIRVADFGLRLPEFSARPPGARGEKVGTTAETYFSFLPWHTWLEGAPKGEVRCRFVAFTDARGRGIEDTMRLDRLFRWGGTPDEMAWLREALALVEFFTADGAVLCFALVPVSSVLLASIGELETDGADLHWSIETEWRADAHAHVPEGVELAGGPIAIPFMDLVLQTRTRVESGGVGRTLGRILLTPLTLTLDVVTLGLGAMFWSLVCDDDEEGVTYRYPA